MKIISEDALLPFEDYFHRRATVADQLYSKNASADAKILATTALDALAKIWFHDFPETEAELKRHYSGGISESTRLSQLLKYFAKDDPDASKIGLFRPSYAVLNGNTHGNKPLSLKLSKLEKP